jgi:hypothetical protein
VITINIAGHLNRPSGNSGIATVLSVSIFAVLPARTNGFVRVGGLSVCVGSVVHVKRGSGHVTITLRRYHPGFSVAELFFLVACISVTVRVLEIEPHPANTLGARSIISLEQLSVPYSDFSFAHANHLKRSIGECNIFRVLGGNDR